MSKAGTLRLQAGASFFGVGSERIMASWDALALRRRGWMAVTVWECRMRRPEAVVGRLERLV